MSKVKTGIGEIVAVLFSMVGLTALLIAPRAKRLDFACGLRELLRSLWLGALLLFSAACIAAEFHVDAVRGDDAGDGSREHPWRTLRVAAHRMGKDATCLVHGGTYRGTVTPQTGQSFVAAAGEQAELTGADVLGPSLWRRVSPERPVFVADVATEVRAVFFRGQPMDLARHPNHRGDRLATDSWGKVVVNEGRADCTARVEFPGEKWVTHQWVGGVFCGVGGDNGYSANYGLITRSGESDLKIAQANFYLRNQEFQGPGHGYITRHLRALDAPGEWHWERGKLYFWPPDGMAPRADDVEAQVRLWGFDLTGSERVTLRGLRFRGASVLLEKARRCLVEHCVFRQHAPWSFASGEDVEGIGERHSFRFGFARDGTSGLHVSGSDNVIRACDIAHAWGGGVSLLGERNAVEDCLIEDVGWLARQDVAPIWICGDGHRVERCTVRHAAGMGICATQFGPLLVKRPRIFHNRISDVGRLLVDSGSSGIYLSNHDAPTEDRSLAGGVIAWNHISGVQVVRGSKGFGIYLDDGTDHAVIHHNVVDGGGRLRWGIFIHYAQHFSDDLGIYHNTLWGVREQAIFAGGRSDVGGTRGMVCRNNLAQRGAMRSLRGEFEASHNRIGATAEEFANVTALDFRLRSGKSPAVNAGVAIPGINDEVKDGKPDLGAYEFGSAPWEAGSSLKPEKPTL
jgi:hypothetical protein